jgi:hypothetical protein
MAYSVDTYSGSKRFVVEDGTINNELDIRLVGKNFSGYGEIQNENLLHLLENFAGLIPPSNPINGQFWYDSANRKIKFWDNTINKWKSAGGIEVNSSAPTGSTVGDLWWDEINKQLYAFDGSTYILVGPQSLPGIGTTQMKALTVKDILDNVHGVIAAFVDGKVMYLISRDIEYELDANSKSLLGAPGDFTKVYPGITMVNTLSSGVTASSSNSIIWGTASSALGLVGPGNSLLDYTDFLSSSTNLNNFSVQVKFSDSGYLLGDNEQLLVRISENPLEPDTPIFLNRVGNTLKFQTTETGVGIRTPLVLEDNNILPGTNNATDIGSLTLTFKNIYANKFYGDGFDLVNLNLSNFVGILSPSQLSGTYNINISGTADSTENANKLKLGSLFVESAIGLPDQGSQFGNTIVARDIDGNINASFFQGTATSALFADLAEKYLADAEYEVGTVVSVGGDAEVTACQNGDRPLGAVSANPAYMMNSGLEGGTYIALKGRVPVKVIGPVKKGEKLIASNNGYVSAVSNSSHLYDTFAIALETNDSSNVKLIEAVIL